MTRTAAPAACQTRHAIILAAGASRRTRPLTLERPKPLIPLLGQPLLAHILDELVGLVQQVTLVVGYRAEDIRAHFGTRYRDMQLVYVHQHVVNGTAGALLTVAEQASAAGVPLDAPFFLLYGDNLVSHTDIVNVCQQRYAMAALPVDDPTGFGILEVDGGRVLRIIEKPPHAPPGSLSNPGIFHFDQHVLPVLRRITPSPRGEYELTDLVTLLAQEQHVGYSVCAGQWVPIGNPWEALIASQFLLQQRAARRPDIHPQAQIAEGCQLEGYVSIGRARLESGCRIQGPACIADDVTLAAGCTVDQSVLEAGAQVGTGSRVAHSVVGGGAQVGAGCSVQQSWLDDRASVGEGTELRAQTFADVQPAAYTVGLLDVAAMQQRGVVLGPGVSLPAGAAIEPGSVLFPDAHPAAQ
jgi:bifunctional UDP-N-acetylglucosamine pyrophosphorylase/glucosamine-1-phosphate N-acetyltransferase